MKIGTKSLLYGAHQFIIHPITVLLAWHELYGWPNWKECICIFIHDIGYWGKKNMEGDGSLTPEEFSKDPYQKYDDGIYHPIKGAVIAQEILDEQAIFETSPEGKKICIKPYGNQYCHLVAYHSRTYANLCGEPPSKLCWADKLCVKFDPWWLYLPRVILSGEIHEYREEAIKAGLIPKDISNRDWYEWAKARMIRKAYAKDSRPPYQKEGAP